MKNRPRNAVVCLGYGHKKTESKTNSIANCLKSTSVFNHCVWQGVSFVNWVFEETYNYDIMNMRFFPCMN